MMMKFDQNRRWLLASSSALGLSWMASLVFANPEERVVKIVAKKFEFIPSEIKLIKGIPVVLELTSLDVLMGFGAPDLNLRSLIIPNKVMKVNFVPDKVGTFPFICDVFCGDGHEDMGGKIIVVE
jgi:cytochrome c oxidase subunit II